jgi:2-polyprenyl-3-methyl-5-hydroxy-6-metoxy-1,4-benzoquinol methylase
MLLILQDEIKKRDILEIEAGQNNFSKTKKKYKLVIFMDTIKHFKNPKSVLAKVKKILVKDGLIAILTPNYKSRMTDIAKNGARFYFSPYSMKLLFLSLGYEIQYKTTFDNYYDFKKTIKSSAIRVLLLSPLYFLTRRFFWLTGRGGLVFVLAGKRYNRRKK